MDNQPGIILFGHGARDAAWAGPMQRVAEKLTADAPQARVSLAFMEFMTPTLDDAVDQLVDAGSREIVVVPVFLAQGGHLKRDVPMLVDAAAARHPGVNIALVAAAGESPQVVDAIAVYAKSQFEKGQMGKLG